MFSFFPKTSFILFVFSTIFELRNPEDSINLISLNQVFLPKRSLRTTFSAVLTISGVVASANLVCIVFDMYTGSISDSWIVLVFGNTFVNSPMVISLVSAMVCNVFTLISVTGTFNFVNSLLTASTVIASDSCVVTKLGILSVDISVVVISDISFNTG